jgi:hypothetical protein
VCGDDGENRAGGSAAAGRREGRGSVWLQVTMVKFQRWLKYGRQWMRPGMGQQQICSSVHGF